MKWKNNKRRFTTRKIWTPKKRSNKIYGGKGEPYKVELINDLPEDAIISFYKQGEFTDLCAGPHVAKTGNIKAVKLLTSSGAYWRGNEKIKCYKGFMVFHIQKLAN